MGNLFPIEDHFNFYNILEQKFCILNHIFHSNRAQHRDHVVVFYSYFFGTLFENLLSRSTSVTCKYSLTLFFCFLDFSVVCNYTSCEEPGAAFS